MIFKLPSGTLFITLRGQATLLAILIATAVAVVTAVGVTSRQNSSVRRSTYTAQTDQAFSCANSAVDVALACITNVEKSGGSPLTNCTTAATGTALSGSNCTFNYTVSNLTDSTINISTLTKDSVQQFNTSGNSTALVRWRKIQSSADNSALELTFAFENPAGTFSMQKTAVSCGTPPSGISISGFGSPLTPDGNGYCTLSYGITNFPNSIVRVKPLFSSVELTFTLSNPQNQGYKINATGVAGGTVRNIEVLRMNPQLPSIFDYVLYSEEGSITK